MGKYVPGAQIKAFTETVRPSMAVEVAFEHGFYEGDYAVVSTPGTPLRPELEKIRQAAHTRWPQTEVSFGDIIDWVREGAPDVLTGELPMRASPLPPEKGALHLIHNGVFERQW